MHYLLFGNYTWFPRREAEMKEAMERYLQDHGIALCGFFPGKGSLSGPGDTVFCEMLVSSSSVNLNALGELVGWSLRGIRNEEFEKISAFDVTYITMLNKEMIKVITNECNKLAE